VITGSFNFTKAAEENNAENLLENCYNYGKAAKHYQFPVEHPPHSLETNLWHRNRGKIIQIT